MPQMTATFSFGNLGNKLAEFVDLKQFECVYCNHSHPSDWFSLEHIIPKSLFNKSYVLSKACRLKNNYMSYAFEIRALNSDSLSELLILFDPPKKPVYRGIFKNNMNLELVRWSLPSGKFEFGNARPDIEYRDNAEVMIEYNDGTKGTFMIDLPFKIVHKITGAPHMNKVFDRIAEKTHKELFYYLDSINKGTIHNDKLSEFLELNKAKFIFTEVAVTRELGEQKSLSRDIKFIVEGDDEAINMLLLKIAWTHAVKQLGREKLLNPISDSIIIYLTSFHINDKRLISVFPDLFIKSYTIGDKEYIFWKYDIPRTIKMANELRNDDEKNNLLRHIKYRIDRFEFFKNIIVFNSEPILNIETDYQNPTRRFHYLNIFTLSDENGSRTVCEIKLFGGAVNVLVQLSEVPVADIYPEAFRVDF